MHKIFHEKNRLAKLLFSVLPNGFVREKEWSWDGGRMIAVTGCLYARLPLSSASKLATSLLLPQAADQLYAILTLPCWRHTIRVDQDGGISLYIERDWDENLLEAICGWFAASRGLAEAAIKLARQSGGSIGGIGIHWSRTGSTRLRFYVFVRPGKRQWGNVIDNLFADFCNELGCFIPSWIYSLAEQPRRACIVNVEDRSGSIAVKIELPDVMWSELATHRVSMGMDALDKLDAYKPGRVRYIGARLGTSGTPDVTFYLPINFPREGILQVCGSPT